jgi:hypothetical protein
MVKSPLKLIPLLLLLSSCISQFIPKTSENQEIFVVEGLITDQPEVNTIKLSTSMPLGERTDSKPLSGYSVSVVDNLSNVYLLKETDPGTYVTDPESFRGVIGRIYTLHITSNIPDYHFYTSYPMEMTPVPPIDSLYYEKEKITDYGNLLVNQEGCQIFLNTKDPEKKCNYYRWEYDETWEIRIPYSVPNYICWINSKSDQINIKSTVNLNESVVQRYPLNFVSNQTDRLKYKYSMLVKQYSLSEIEYNYWDKLQTMSEQVGGLYDILPSSVPSNVFCSNYPDEKVLGFFSVSASTSKRIFVKDHFAGVANLYTNDACIADTVFNNADIPGLNVYAWVIIDNFLPPYKIITYTHGCADCTVRGTNLEPDYWRDGK